VGRKVLGSSNENVDAVSDKGLIEQYINGDEARIKSVVDFINQRRILLRGSEGLGNLSFHQWTSYIGGGGGGKKGPVLP
jgi:hypothetical protein